MPEYDLYRDTPVRFLGYANELAEAFRPVINRFTIYSGYGLAIGYMIADVGDKTYQISKVEERKEKWLMMALDTGMWQALASLIIPSITINRFSASSRFMMKKITNLGDRRIKMISVVLSIAIIPFIVKPIDKSVDYLMDNYVRDRLGTKTKTG